MYEPKINILLVEAVPHLLKKANPVVQKPVLEDTDGFLPFCHLGMRI